MHPSSPLRTHGLAAACAIAAAAAPSLLAYNLSPSPTVLNQVLALGLWGLCLVVAGPYRRGPLPWPVLSALAGVALGVVWSWGPGALPSTLALSALGLLAAAAAVLVAAASPLDGAALRRGFILFCWAWVVTGVLNVALAMVQVFAPDWPDGRWVAISTIAGRAVGNLRQPNHLSSLLLWGCVAVVALWELRQLRRVAALALLGSMVFAVVLTASRTGLVSVCLLALWGLADRRLAGGTRLALLALPLVYGAGWWAMAQSASLLAQGFGGAQRLAEADISGSRFTIWLNTLELIRQQPWTGVGWGEYNLAWTLTPMAQRHPAFFDHAHNLPLHLLAELGVPLGGAVMVLLVAGVVLAGWRAWRAPGDQGTVQRCALLMVVMIGLHSLLEYPLWYAYFLLPAAWAWGTASARPDGSATAAAAAPAAGPWTARSPAAWAAGGAMVVAAVVTVVDYASVVRIFHARGSALSLAERIDRGQRSWLFAHHADYAALTSGSTVLDPHHDFARAIHYLLDTRLMIAWAQAHADARQPDAARFIAQRLREFRREDAQAFFQSCPPAGAAGADAPFQCQAPIQAPDWRQLVQGR